MTPRARPLSASVAPAWSHVVGVGAARVVVYEDLARDRQLTLRWWNPARQNWRRHSLARVLDRDRRGTPTTASTEWAINEATVKSAALVRGTPDAVVPAPALFTIGQTRAALIDRETGKYPHETPLRAEILRAVDYAATVWGSDTPWSAIDDAEWTKLIRRRLESLLLRGKRGVRATEITVSRLATVTRWLRKKHIPRDAGIPPESWRQDILEHWRGVTGSKRDPQPHRPRHTLDEMRKILAIASVVDPRLDLLLALGAEYRLGQISRAWRSDLDVTARTLKVHGQGKKGGETIELTDGQMVAVFRALGGYLDALEEQHLADGTDYLLFPSGRLLRWRVAEPTLGDRVDLTRSLGKKWIITNFHLAEMAAGVTVLQGRAAYGLRRQAVDAANAAGITRQGLQAAGGWSSTKIPDEVYAEQENRIGREEAKRVRAKIRGENA